ncbi:hypothetical protein [uncultured Microbacterium sp.]|uniref:hypothetical protein n=1 Tax=uncultured Microbacterium sp. TaxID=191216 RepID=UPI003748AC11
MIDDAEGSSADRAMQEDLRDNGVVRLSARDRSSIDGLMHFSLTADCRVPEESEGRRIRGSSPRAA